MVPLEPYVVHSCCPAILVPSGDQVGFQSRLRPASPAHGGMLKSGPLVPPSSERVAKTVVPPSWRNKPSCDVTLAAAIVSVDMTAGTAGEDITSNAATARDRPRT